MDNPYSGDFSCWKDVTGNFSCSEEEPDQVLFADYDRPPYEGYAEVAYRRGDKFFVVSGSPNHPPPDNGGGERE